MRRQRLFFIEICYNIVIFLNDRELVSGYLKSIFENSLIFPYDIQRHKQEMTQVKLVLQNKLNCALFI